MKNLGNATTWSLENDKMEPFAFWEDFFTQEECERVIRLSKKFELEPAKIGNASNEIKKIRDSKIRFIHPNPDTFWIYQKLTDGVVALNNNFFKFDLFSFGEGLQFTEYTAPSGKFEKHIDRYYNGPIRKLSIIVQLSDENSYTGGDVEIFQDDNPQPLNRKRGTLLAFPSFMMHRVTPVTNGKRNSLVGWINGKPFK